MTDHDFYDRHFRRNLVQEQMAKELVKARGKIIAGRFGSLSRGETTPVVWGGWDRAFEDLEDDAEKEEAFAFSLGFANASEYHAETDWCDRHELMVDWQDEGDDVDEVSGYSRSDLYFGGNW